MKKILLFLTILTYLQLNLHAQETLKGDEKHALIHVNVTDMQGNIRVKDQVVFESSTQKRFDGITDQNGRFDILLPEGDEYLIKLIGLGEEENYSTISIGNDEGIYEGEITIQYEPAQHYTLEDVQFASNKSTLRASSFQTLNNLVATLKLKPEIDVEIGGHTDDIGTEDANLKLSQARAEAVVAYLIKKGIDSKRLLAKGYGEKQPIASNKTAEGRQKNRRTEVRILEK